MQHCSTACYVSGIPNRVISSVMNNRSVPEIWPELPVCQPVLVYWSTILLCSSMKLLIHRPTLESVSQLLKVLGINSKSSNAGRFKSDTSMVWRRAFIIARRLMYGLYHGVIMALFELLDSSDGSESILVRVTCVTR